MLGIIGILLVTAIVKSAEIKHDSEEQVEERMFRPQMYDCFTRTNQQGRCIPLKDCPSLRERGRYISRMYVLQAVSDYVCGYSSAIEVCCPDRNYIPEAAALQNVPDQGYGNPGRDTWGSYDDQHFGGDTGGWGQSSRQPWGRPQSPRPSWTQATTARNWRRTTQQPWHSESSEEYGDYSPPRPAPTQRPNGNGRPQQFPDDEHVTQDPDIWGTPNRGWTSTERTRLTSQRPESSSSSTGGSHRNRRLLPVSCGTDVLVNKVLLGNDTALKEYPWMALVRIRLPGGSTFHGCGGSLISPRYVLTAAHCVRIAESPYAKVDQVRLGEHDTRSDPDCEGKGNERICADTVQDIDVERVIAHSQYKAKSKDQQHDIALLRLKTPAQMSDFVQPICLHTGTGISGRSDTVPQSMWVAGWGRTSNDPSSSSPIKQKVALPSVPEDKCSPIYERSAYKLTILDTQMCAGGGRADSCKGDSGGPLMSLDQVDYTFRWHLQGVVSFGPKDCGTVGLPGIYTRVSKYTDWILDNMAD